MVLVPYSVLWNKWHFWRGRWRGSPCTKSLTFQYAFVWTLLPTWSEFKRNILVFKMYGRTKRRRNSRKTHKKSWNFGTFEGGDEGVPRVRNLWLSSMLSYEHSFQRGQNLKETSWFSRCMDAPNGGEILEKDPLYPAYIIHMVKNMCSCWDFLSPNNVRVSLTYSTSHAYLWWRICVPAAKNLHCVQVLGSDNSKKKKSKVIAWQKKLFFSHFR